MGGASDAHLDSRRVILGRGSLELMSGASCTTEARLDEQNSERDTYSLGKGSIHTRKKNIRKEPRCPAAAPLRGAYKLEIEMAGRSIERGCCCDPAARKSSWYCHCDSSMDGAFATLIGLRPFVRSEMVGCGCVVVVEKKDYLKRKSHLE